MLLLTVSLQKKNVPIYGQALDRFCFHSCKIIFDLSPHGIVWKTKIITNVILSNSRANTKLETKSEEQKCSVSTALWESRAFFCLCFWSIIALLSLISMCFDPNSFLLFWLFIAEALLIPDNSISCLCLLWLYLLKQWEAMKKESTV